MGQRSTGRSGSRLKQSSSSPHAAHTHGVSLPRSDSGVILGSGSNKIARTRRSYSGAGTDPYVILPREGKALALAFAGPGGERIARSKANHPGLPPRPFLGLSDQDRTDISQIAAAHLEYVAEG